MTNNQTDNRTNFTANRLIVTALLMLQPLWSQQLITKALDIDKSFTSKTKTQAIRLGLMDEKRVPTLSENLLSSFILHGSIFSAKSGRFFRFALHRVLEQI